MDASEVRRNDNSSPIWLQALQPGAVSTLTSGAIVGSLLRPFSGAGSEFPPVRLLKCISSNGGCAGLCRPITQQRSVMPIDDDRPSVVLLEPLASGLSHPVPAERVVEQRF